MYGPRRVGKTTLVKQYLDSLNKAIKSVYLTGDDFDLQDLFRSGSKTKLINFANQYEVIIIDEAQMIPNIGLGVKMIIDELPNKNIILTGSSALLLSEEVGSPLLGRHFERKILPISFSDIEGSDFNKKNNLESLLIYGSYPEILLTNDNLEKEMRLKEIMKNPYFNEIFFWRNKNGREVDIVIVNNDKVKAFECKWKDQKVVFTNFLENYPKAETFVISKENMEEFLN